MLEKLLTILLVPIIVFPIVVSAAGGDLELVWREFKAFSQAPLIISVQAQVSPPVGPSPPVRPSPWVRPGAPGGGPVPVLTRWGYISASIVLALIALWSLARKPSEHRSHDLG